VRGKCPVLVEEKLIEGEKKKLVVECEDGEKRMVESFW